MSISGSSWRLQSAVYRSRREQSASVDRDGWLQVFCDPSGCSWLADLDVRHRGAGVAQKRVLRSCVSGTYCLRRLPIACVAAATERGNSITMIGSPLACRAVDAPRRSNYRGFLKPFNHQKAKVAPEAVKPSLSTVMSWRAGNNPPSRTGKNHSVAAGHRSVALVIPMRAIALSSANCELNMPVADTSPFIHGS